MSLRINHLQCGSVLDPRGRLRAQECNREGKVTILALRVSCFPGSATCFPSNVGREQTNNMFSSNKNLGSEVVQFFVHYLSIFTLVLQLIHSAVWTRMSPYNLPSYDKN